VEICCSSKIIWQLPDLNQSRWGVVGSRMKRRLLQTGGQSGDSPKPSCGRILERDRKMRQIPEQVAGRDFFLFSLT